MLHYLVFKATLFSYLLFSVATISNVGHSFLTLNPFIQLSLCVPSFPAADLIFSFTDKIKPQHSLTITFSCLYLAFYSICICDSSYYSKLIFPHVLGHLFSCFIWKLLPSLSSTLFCIFNFVFAARFFLIACQPLPPL